MQPLPIQFTNTFMTHACALVLQKSWHMSWRQCLTMRRQPHF